MVGQTILHYRMLEKLGAGGMGEIYKAEDTRLKRIVAIKALSPRLAGEPERRKRFIQEARAASALNHPNIITLYDIISDGDLQCIVMEYVAGKTLREVIPNGGLRAPQALQYATQMAGALAAAHTAGIIHRDLKPSNVMITPTGLVKILDFGLAKWVGPSLSSDSGEQATVDQAITTEGSIIGTVSYMSPEQALGKRVDTRSDIFSFGSVLYEMVTGRRAFEGSSGISTLSAILRDDVAPIREAAPNVPSALEQIILRCLSKEPEARWQSMKEIEGRLVALERQLDYTGRQTAPIPADDLPTVAATTAGGSPSATPPPPPKAGRAARPEPPPAKAAAASKRPAASGSKSRMPIAWTWAVLGGVLMASVGVGGWYLWKGQQRPAPQPTARVVAPPVVTETPAPVPPPFEPPPPQAAPANPPAQPAPAPAASKSPSKKSAFKSVVPQPATPAPAPKAPSAPQTSAAPTPQPALVPPPLPKAAVPTPAIPLVPVTIADALPFQIVLAEDVPTDVEQGKSLRFTVADGLRVGDTLVIAKGATVTGSIAREAGKKKFIFGGGKATFELQLANAVDGKKLNVRATSGRSAEGPATRPFDTGKGSKTKGLIAAQGTVYIAYIDGEQTVSVSK